MSDVVTQQGKRPGDLLVHVESLEYCTKTVKIRNKSATAVTVANMVGYPLIAGTNGADYNLAISGDEANVVALLIDGPTGLDSEVIGATSNGLYKYQALVHSPAILNQDKIALVDYVAGAAFVQATIRTALAALGYELRSQPAQYSQL